MPEFHEPSNSSRCAPKRQWYEMNGQAAPSQSKAKADLQKWGHTSCLCVSNGACRSLLQANVNQHRTTASWEELSAREPTNIDSRAACEILRLTIQSLQPLLVQSRLCPNSRYQTRSETSSPRSAQVDRTWPGYLPGCWDRHIFPSSPHADPR